MANLALTDVCVQPGLGAYSTTDIRKLPAIIAAGEAAAESALAAIRAGLRSGRGAEKAAGDALGRLPGEKEVLLVALGEAVRMALGQRLAQPGQELRVLRARESADPLHGRDVAVELVGAEREAGLQHGR